VETNPTAGIVMKELLLVKLPKVPNLDQDFFGIGFYTDHGFVFSLLNEKTINLHPLRNLPFPSDTGYASENQIEVLGIIKNLPNRPQE
jgi:hypothetical protein